MSKAERTIDSFSGEHRFLSNFYRCRVVLDGMPYPSAEHAFQAAKTLDLDDREEIQRKIAPVDAKLYGRRLLLRDDWEDIKWEMMWQVLVSKFSNHQLGAKLIATHPASLVEGNTWCDNTWGDCRCSRHTKTAGSNALGRELMMLRDELLAGRSGETASRPWLNNRWWQ